jgi:uncharacterized protein YqeY
MTYEQVQKELIQAMKNKDTVRKSVLGDIKTTALNIAIEEKHKLNVTEENVAAAMKKYQKVCQAQIDTCPANRPDLMEAFQACMNCITEYLPKQLTEEEINEILTTVQPKTMPEAMKIFALAYKGQVDMKLVNKLAGEYIKK